MIIGQTSVGIVVAFLSGFERFGEPIRDMLFYREMEQSRVEYDLIRDWPESAKDRRSQPERHTAAE